jgi:hypothetical protein
VSTRKFIRDLKRQASVAGFESVEVVQTKASHFKATFTDGRSQWTVPVSSSPTNYEHAINNVVQDLRRLKRGAVA